MTVASVQALVPMLDYQQSRAHLFPSIESIRWYVRKHRAPLVDAGALLLHTNQWFLSPTDFDAYIVQAGKSAAQSA